MIFYPKIIVPLPPLQIITVARCYCHELAPGVFSSLPDCNRWLIQQQLVIRQISNEHPRRLALLLFSTSNKMPNNSKCAAYQQLNNLVALMVSDQAIAYRIITARSIRPLLLFFLDVTTDQQLRPWLIPRPDCLKESRWLKIVGWLLDHDVFVVDQKTTMADFLLSSHLLRSNCTLKTVRTVMSHSLSPDVEHRLLTLFEKWL